MKLLKDLDIESEVCSFRSGIEDAAEAIAFQGGSKFPAELTTLWDKVFAFCDKHDEVHGNPTNVLSTVQKHTRVKEYIDTTISKEIKAVIKKNTGIEISDVITAMPTSLRSATDVYIAFSTEDYNEEIADELSDMEKAESFKENLHEMGDWKDISKKLDKAKGRMLKNIKITAYLCIPIGMFVIKDITSEKMIPTPLTSEEITSVILHEVGHMISGIEYITDTCFLGYYGNSFLRQIKDLSKTDIDKALSITIDAANDVLAKNNNTKYTKLLSGSVKALQLIQASQVNSQIAVDKKDVDNYHVGMGIVEKVILMPLITFCVGIVVAATVMMPFVEYASLSTAIADNSNTNEFVTFRKESMYERLADEYVSRYGMSKQLVNALIKIGKQNKHAQTGHNDILASEYVRNSMAYAAMINLLTIPTKILSYLVFLISETNQFSSYESTSIRLRRNVNNTVDILKDPTISKEVRQMLANDIDAMNKALDENKSLYELKLYDKLVKFVMQVIPMTISGTFQRLIDGSNLSKEYTELFNQLDELLSNRSFYYAAKISKSFRR